MSVRTASLLLTGLIALAVAPVQAQTPNQTPTAGSDSFQIPQEPLAEQGYVIATLVANMRECGAGEQALTVFYNHEKRQAISQAAAQPDAGQRFDQGFVLGSEHMQVLRGEGHLKPDQRTCQALGQRLHQAR